MKKRLFSIISIIACLCLVFSMSFNFVSAEEPVDSAAEQEMTESGFTKDYFDWYIDPWVQAWFTGDMANIKSYDGQFDGQGVVIEYSFEEGTYKNDFEKAGQFKQYDLEQVKMSEENKVFTLSKVAVCSDRNVHFTFAYDMATGTITWTVDVDQTMGELVGKAGLNTLMGMGTVFLVLIFISFIIALFSIIRKAGEKKAPAVVETPAAPVPETVTVPEAVSAAEDEIAAVIAAAIAAYEADNDYMEVPADGLIVRSIKKRGFAN